VERNEIQGPSPSDLWAIAAVLGLDVRLSAYPGGEPVRDHVQLRLLEAFRARIDPALRWRTEMPLPIEGDRRAWDAMVISPEGWTAIEAISRLGAVDATVRRALLKLRDDPRVTRLVLLISDTARNRAALAAAGPVITSDLPVATRAILGTLSVGRMPMHDGIVILRVPGANPQSVHSGGKLVDGGLVGPPGFVDNRLGGGATVP
jgi:hypothetical protein